MRKRWLMIGIGVIGLLALLLPPSAMPGVKADSVNFQVTVVNSDFNGWPGAGVEVWDGASLIASGNTNSEGNVFFDLTVGGPYEFRAGDASTMASASNVPDAVLVGVILMPTEVSTNQPPVADAGDDQTLEQTSHAGAEVILNGSGSSDPDGDPITYEWTWDSNSASGVSPTITLPLGSTTVTLTVSDDGGLSDTDEVVITVQDTTPPMVNIISPEDGKTYLNTQGPILVTYTATDVCDPEPDISLTLDGEPFAGTEIDLCGLGSGEHTLTVTATDDCGNTADASSLFTVEPQSLETFVIRHMLIHWNCHGAGGPPDGFTILGRFQLPAGYTPGNLDPSAAMNINIAGESGGDSVAFQVRPLNKLGVIWRYRGSEQPPGEGANITNMIIWWAPQSSKLAGWAGFFIKGVLDLPDNISVGTEPAEATLTLEIPTSGYDSCGSLAGDETIAFQVYPRACLWMYNTWHPLAPNFPWDPTGNE